MTTSYSTKISAASFNGNVIYRVMQDLNIQERSTAM